MGEAGAGPRWHPAGPIVLVMRLPAADALWLGELAVQAGIACLEVTTTEPDWQEALDALRSAHPGAEVGVGSLRTSTDVLQAAEAGAAFGVSAIAVPGGALAAHEAGIGWVEGAATPSEIAGAWDRGADVVKVFPAGALGGADYLRAVRGPLPDIPLLPSGGVGPGDVADCLAAGAVAVALGSSIATPDERARRDAEPVMARLGRAVAAARG
jgi:2-dehydro-3-deoxyphosphogluconate aldolase/(4S)-4-hydroxy-2-oxoglutarate aldolase